jgi:hypothetical protein
MLSVANKPIMLCVILLNVIMPSEIMLGVAFFMVRCRLIDSALTDRVTLTYMVN